MPGSSDRTLENYTCCRFVVLRIDPGVARVCNQIKWADARAVELVHYAPFDIQISRVLVGMVFKGAHDRRYIPFSTRLQCRRAQLVAQREGICFLL
jgi:hypothetical protein